MSKQYHAGARAKENHMLDSTAGHGTSEHAGNRADDRRKRLSYQSLAHNRRQPVEHPAELAAEQAAYRARFPKRDPKPIVITDVADEHG